MDNLSGWTTYIGVGVCLAGVAWIYFRIKQITRKAFIFWLNLLLEIKYQGNEWVKTAYFALEWCLACHARNESWSNSYTGRQQALPTINSTSTCRNSYTKIRDWTKRFADLGFIKQGKLAGRNNLATQRSTKWCANEILGFSRRTSVKVMN